MCYTIPGRVVAVEPGRVRLDYFGQEKSALNEFYSLAVGDYIYAQGGYVIKKVPEPEAQESLLAWRELFFELQNIDLRLSRFDFGQEDLPERLRLVLNKALEGYPLAREELIYLFNLKGSKELEMLFKAANFIRQRHLQNSCCVHGILEISNYCRRHCLYCGISQHNQALVRYRLSRAEIVAAAGQAINDYGFQTLVLQSGQDSGYDLDELAQAIREIKEKNDVLIFVSFGEVGQEGLEKLYQAGARGLLLRFETSNPKIYAQLHPGQDLEGRLAQIKAAYQMGYLIITGGLIGLPGQTAQDLVDDLFLAKELHAEMYSFGPFLPSPATPLADCAPPAREEVLKVLALARLVDPAQAKILVTTALETLSPVGRQEALQSGANSVMLNVTPLKYRALYSLYPDRAYSGEEIDTQITETIALLKSLGRAPTDLGKVAR